MKTIAVTTLAVIAYASILFFRSDDPVKFTFFGMEGATYPRMGVFAVYLYACAIFSLGPGLLIKAYRKRWIRSIQIMGRNIDVTDSNVESVIQGILATGLTLLIGLVVILVPTSELRISRIEMGGYFVVGLIGSFGSAIWASRKLSKAEKGV